MMKEEQFTAYLEQDAQISSKENAVKSRISRARRVEETLNVNLDTVVQDDRTMYDTLKKIKAEFGDANGAIQNAVRKYYVFINNRKFPSMLTYERQNRL